MCNLPNRTRIIVDLDLVVQWLNLGAAKLGDFRRSRTCFTPGKRRLGTVRRRIISGRKSTVVPRNRL